MDPLRAEKLHGPSALKVGVLRLAVCVTQKALNQPPYPATAFEVRDCVKGAFLGKALPLGCDCMTGKAIVTGDIHQLMIPAIASPTR